MVAVVDAQPQFAVEIRPASPAGDRSCLDDRDGVPRFAQRHGGGQSGQAGADDMDVHATPRPSLRGRRRVKPRQSCDRGLVA